MTDKKIKEELAKKDETIQEYTDQLKRLQAEFENYAKRVEKERLQVMASASERVVAQLVHIKDDFDRALADLSGVSEDSRKGIEMISKNLNKILESEQVKEVESEGKADPFKHEVIMKVESTEPENTILEEIQKGYSMNGKVIRYAKVKVSKGPTKDTKGNMPGGN